LAVKNFKTKTKMNEILLNKNQRQRAAQKLDQQMSEKQEEQKEDIKLEIEVHI
jgi:hypothetical protein